MQKPSDFNHRLLAVENEVRKLRNELTRLCAEIGAIRQQNDAAIFKKEDADNKGPAAPLTVLVEDTPLDRKSPDHQPLRGKHKLQKTLKFVGVLAGIGYAIVTFFQWRDLRSNFQADERAWLGPNGVTLTSPYNANHVAIVVDYFNSGKTPAHIDSTSTMVGLAHGEKSIDWFSTSTGGAQDVAPNYKTPVTTRTKLPITDDQFQDIVNMKMAVDFKMIVYYHDVFGKGHSTEVCVSVTGSEDELKQTGQIVPTCGPTKMN